MTDTASKVTQLTQSLQEAQAKVTKKKEEIDQKHALITEMHKTNLGLEYKLQEKARIIAIKKDALLREKELKKRAIEDLKKIIGADKGALQAEKAELEKKVSVLDAEFKTLSVEKQQLLSSYQLNAPAEERKEETKDADEDADVTLESLTKNFKPNKEDSGFLDVKSLTRIIDICTTLAGKKFKEQVQENRKKLRKLVNEDLAAYLEQAGKEMTQHTTVYQEIENDVLKALGLEKKAFDSSIEFYMAQGNFEIYSLMNMLGDKLKSFLTATKKIDKETFRQILQCKLEFVKNEADKIFSKENRMIVAQKSFAHVKGTFEEKEEPSVMVLKNYFEFRMGMEIYNKFEVEEEDVREASLNPEIQYDIDITQLMIETEKEFYAHIPKVESQQQEKQVNNA